MRNIRMNVYKIHETVWEPSGLKGEIQTAIVLARTATEAVVNYGENETTVIEHVECVGPILNSGWLDEAYKQKQEKGKQP